jgi:alpha-beta hydrolase superfamily lysophospholipase
VVLLHGLTDAPYSLRHIARFYVDHRYVAVGIRMPAHGTVPGALMSAHWEDWLAATRLAVREADRLAGGRPLEIVGYSNGAAVALKYALDALAEPELPQAQRLVLISPMLGLGHFARYAGIAGWPAVLHGFAKAAWIDILPEFNPFKYNSFPINGARQSYALTQTVARGFAERAEQGKLAGFPPVIAFQSVVDATVNTAGTFSGLFAHLPANGSEIVLFDVNRASRLQSLLKDAALTTVDDLLPAGPQSYRVTIIGNAPGQPAVTETTVEPGAAATHERGLGIDYPLDLFSLSHVALPFPHTDSLYGSNPRDAASCSSGCLSSSSPRSSGAILDRSSRCKFKPRFLCSREPDRRPHWVPRRKAAVLRLRAEYWDGCWHVSHPSSVSLPRLGSPGPRSPTRPRRANGDSLPVACSCCGFPC